MAKAPANTSKDVTAATAPSIGADVFAAARAASLVEAGFLPYFTKEEKTTLSQSGIPLFVLGARWKTSTRFRNKDTGQFRDDAELFITTDLGNPAKQGIWGGLPDTTYWRAMIRDLTHLLDLGREQGNENPSIGPVFAHEREYTNDWGTFPSFDFQQEPQNGTASAAGAGVTPSGSAVQDEELPF